MLQHLVEVLPYRLLSVFYPFGKPLLCGVSEKMMHEDWRLQDVLAFNAVRRSCTQHIRLARSVTTHARQHGRHTAWTSPKVTTVTEIVIDHFQKWRQLQRSYLTTSKSDDSYRDRTWPYFQKWRQLQRSYLTTSKSDDSYRDRTSAYSKSDDSHRDHRQIEAFVRDFLQKRISKVNFWRQSHEASPRQARGKPEASPRQARGRLNPPFRGAYFRRRSSALFLAKHSISRAGYLPKSYFKLQKWQQSQRSYFTTSKSDDSYRDRTWPLPKVTTVTEIVLDHFQKWRQLQRSYLTTSKSDDSYKDRTSPLPKVTTVTEIVLDHFQKRRQLQRS